MPKLVDAVFFFDDEESPTMIGEANSEANTTGPLVGSTMSTLMDDKSGSISMPKW
jgi:hypothetical protein